MFIALFNAGSSPSALLKTPGVSLELALDPYQMADKKGHFECPDTRIYQTLAFNTPESLFETVPMICANTGRIIASWCRLDNRADLAANLHMDNRSLSGTADPQLILLAYERWGNRCVEYLVGDFSFCIFDPKEKTVFAARDPMGVKPLYYCHLGGVLVVASGARVFHALEGLELTPDEEWMALHLIGRSESLTATPWPQVSKLAPGHTLSFSANAKLSLSKYFSFKDDSTNEITRSQDRLEAYQLILEESVRCRLRTNYPLGCETSGGLDSSTVTGYAARNWKQDNNDLHAFGFAFLDQEISLILETSRLHNIANNHIVTTRQRSNLAQLLDRSLTVLGYPEEHSNGTTHDQFYRDASRFNVRTLLSGFGGDEVVTNSGSLLWAELIDQGKLLVLLKNLPGMMPVKAARLAKLLSLEFRKPRVSPMFAAGVRRWEQLLVRDNVTVQYDLRKKYLQPLKYSSPYRRINSFVLGDRLGPAVSTRLDNCTLMAASRKIDYRWPLLDVRLIQRYLSTPSIEKYGAGNGRYLHRRAIEGTVPNKIQWKPKEMGQAGPTNALAEEGGSYLADRYESLCENLHGGLENIFDIKKFESSLPQINKITAFGNSSAEISIQSVYLHQLRKLESLNAWLHKYHS